MKREDRHTTAPGPPPRFSTDPAERAPDAGASSLPASGTDPGIDPILLAFDRPPRPPAPQPLQQTSSDGEDFAAHYVSPRQVAHAGQRPAKDDPAVLVELGALAVTTSAGAHSGPPLPTVLIRQRSWPRAVRVGLAASASVALAVFFAALVLSKASTVAPTVASSATASSAASEVPTPPLPSSLVVVAPPVASTTTAVVLSSARPSLAPPVKASASSKPTPHPGASSELRSPRRLDPDSPDTEL